MREVVVAAALRTPVGKAYKGTLRQTRPDDLGNEGRCVKSDRDPHGKESAGYDYATCRGEVEEAIPWRENFCLRPAKRGIGPVLDSFEFGARLSGGDQSVFESLVEFDGDAGG